VPNFDKLTLNTKRLLLRPLRESDAPAYFSIRSDPTVMRYGSTLPMASLDVAVARIARGISEMQSGLHLCLGLERVEDSALIGSCSLFNLDEQCRRAEIGYEMHRDAWGNGYMHEALLALLEYGFSDMALNRVEADVHPDNVGSAKSLERLGFKKEGHLKERWIVGDEISDSLIYGLLLSDWQAAQRSV
jgi:ribosomal-protein-alanine N-acetyltransferase